MEKRNFTLTFVTFFLIVFYCSCVVIFVIYLKPHMSEDDLVDALCVFCPVLGVLVGSLWLGANKFFIYLRAVEETPLQENVVDETIEDDEDDEEFFIAYNLELCLEGNLACIKDKDAIISFMKKTKSFQFQPDQGFYFFDHDTIYQKKVEIKDYLEAMLELTSGNWESVLIANVPPFQHEGKSYSIQNGEIAKGPKTCEHVLLYPDW